MNKICLNMIVKNEESVLRRLFDSVKDIIDYWVISDTGSTDSTLEILEAFKSEVPGEYHQDEWVDYSYNRNIAINHAKGKGDYILFLDADEIISKQGNFDKNTLTADRYDLELHLGGLRYWRPMLVKNTLDWRYEGKCHEYLHCTAVQSIDRCNSLSIIDFYDGGNRSTKFQREIALLLKGIEEEPTNSRYMFYIAQTYYDNSMFTEAIAWYQKRIDMGGWYEEVWHSLYKKALCSEKIPELKNQVSGNYLHAYQYDPRRCEPLYHLCQYYRLMNWNESAVIFGNQAIKIKYPSWCSLFVDETIYQWKVFDELSVAEYNIGMYALSYHHCIEALKSENIDQNNKLRIEANAKFSLERMV